MRTMPPVRLAVSFWMRRRPGSVLAATATDGNGQHRDRQQDHNDRAGPFQQAGQKACPMPIYSSNKSPPGTLFNGTAMSSRIGPMDV